MIKLLSRLAAKRLSRSGDAFNSSTAPSETITLTDDRSVIAYEFDGSRLLFDADCDWRFIGSLPVSASRATIALVAEAYFRGFERAEGELREVGVSDEQFALAREYRLAQHRPPANRSG